MAEVWNDVKRGAGWAVGFGSVLGAAFVLKRGAQPALKSAMKGLLRLRTVSAEMAERVQDIYAEAEAEYAAETLAKDDDQPSQSAG